jgi:hypothetical protein
MLWFQRSEALVDMEIKSKSSNDWLPLTSCLHLAGQSLDPDRG